MCSLQNIVTGTKAFLIITHKIVTQLSCASSIFIVVVQHLVKMLAEWVGVVWAGFVTTNAKGVVLLKGLGENIDRDITVRSLVGVRLGTLLLH